MSVRKFGIVERVLFKEPELEIQSDDELVTARGISELIMKQGLINGKNVGIECTEERIEEKQVLVCRPVQLR